MPEAVVSRRSPEKRTRKRNEEVAAKAASYLHQSGYPALRRVQCSFSDGVLRLCGTLPSFHLRQVAESLAAGLPEVYEVESRLDVS